MKRIAYYPLHYGAEYLAWSVRSVQDAVDEIHMLYTPRPSYGFSTDLACPDSEEKLRAEAEKFASIPIVWHHGTWSNEGAHRDAIHEIVRSAGATQVLAVDADEVWLPGEAQRALDRMVGNSAARSGVSFLHFWRGFNWVCEDHWEPIRVLNANSSKMGAVFWGDQEPLVYHFGYAQLFSTVEYKWSCHGHKNELRENWLREKYAGWKPGDQDVHPTTRDIWNPRPVSNDEREKLKQVLWDHPYFELETISC